MTGLLNRGRNTPYLQRRVRRGDPISADERNAIVDALNRTNTGIDGARDISETARAREANFRQCRIKAVEGDFLRCVLFVGRPGDGDNERESGPFNVARPFLLRTSLASHNDVTFVYPNNLTRTASASGEDDETQVIVPAYAIGDIIVAIQNIVGGTGAIDLKGKSLRWIDLNLDARAWAKQAE